MFDVTWLLAFLSLTGSAFNVKKSVVCFYIWAIGEICWMALDIKSHTYGRAFLDLTQLCFALWGIYEWNKKGEKTIKKLNLNEQAKEIIRIAEKCGVQSNFFFLTTFKRYQTQLEILDKLEKAIKKDGLFVYKEYVKDQKNIRANPAVCEFNKTTDSANKTVSVLLRIIRNLDISETKDELDPLLKMINGEDID